MPSASFIHLRVHSAYSLSEGAIKVSALVKRCRETAMPAVAITDTNNLFGAMEFASAASAQGIQPIIGCQLGITRPDHARRGGKAEAPDQMVLLAKDPTGYETLMALVSAAYLDSEPGQEPQVAIEAFTDRHAGLIALSGGPGGTLGRLIAAQQQDRAREIAGQLKELFGDRFYIELMRHGLDLEDDIEDGLIDIAYDQSLPLVATNDVYFADAAQYEAHDALLCIADSAYVSQENRRRLTPDHRFKTAAEMRSLFADVPEAVDNTLVIARRCAVKPVPKKPILPAFGTGAGRDEAAELKVQAEQGLRARLDSQILAPSGAPLSDADRDAAAAPYWERLERELGIISQMGFPGYFLIVAEFIQWAKAHDIPVGPGRGSGAGSVVAWALTITDLDPLRFGLLFERFLNPERVSMPDFDVDFCQDRRDEVIAHVQERYGRDRVAQIITFGKLQARAVLRDVGRVLQMPYGQVDKICKLVPNNPANPMTLDEAIESEPQLRELQRSDDAVERMINIARQLEGLYRHASTHAAGVVIGDRRLDQLVPLYRDPRSDMPVTQFNMKDVEKAGLVKFDFLGLKTLTVLARAVALLREQGTDLDLAAIPLDDPPTFEMLGRGEAAGVFQLESSGMRDVLRRLKPDRFEDLIAVVALYRPGPMDNIPSYIRRKHGQEQPDYLHPSLEGILKETYGIMIYQEQVMQIAQVLAGYSLGGADLLRRAMGKKIKAEMEAQRKTFVDGAVATGVDKAKASTIFDLVNKFAGYGFNKSHAAAYALVAYQTAFLKANFPVAFLAASMTLDMGNTDKLNGFRQEARRLGITLLPPDINRSRVRFGVETMPDGSSAIRYALAAVKNVGDQAMAGLVRVRQQGGPFRDFNDLAGRLDGGILNKRLMENLAKAGAFDSLDANRRRVHDGAETILGLASAAATDRTSGQDNLFAGAAAEPVDRLRLPDVEDWPATERLAQEFSAIGFYLSAHPLDAYGPTLNKLGVVTHEQLLAAVKGSDRKRYKLAGIFVSKKERNSRKGTRFAFVTLSDASGTYEVTFFSETLATSRALLEDGAGLILTVTANPEDEDSVRLTVEAVAPLDGAVTRAGTDLRVFLDRPDPLEPIKSLLDRQGRGRGAVTLVLGLTDNGLREVELDLPGGFQITPDSRAALKQIPGVIDVHYA